MEHGSGKADEVKFIESTEARNVNNATAAPTVDVEDDRKPPEVGQEASRGINAQLSIIESCTQADRRSPSTTTVHFNAKNNNFKAAPNIPDDIVFMILGLLQTKTLLSARLVSKAFSELGAGLLFPTFVLKPNGDEFGRIKAVAAHPHHVNEIKSIRVESGTVDIYHIVEGLVFAWVWDYNHIFSPLRFAAGYSSQEYESNRHSANSRIRTMEFCLALTSTRLQGFGPAGTCFTETSKLEFYCHCTQSVQF
ncbi:hypothetical protein ONS95_013716 [Cadophora gregata]|uniref:uncharacterized protein n=1 Tax=Cadophora gregata TaxID=51156 RepID=UPI0026DCB5E1|nr:uncharacterized protein ONS95_013716 [Cadophora gregata]KAK0113458.1 hypothetical protein ONS96_014324 [Cadophora gregata f. sp. sojae]KAK0114217.1 hypothetical protein ONS95_013716 [Cadophora gregata]